jgi:hypothetical protein
MRSIGRAVPRLVLASLMLLQIAFALVMDGPLSGDDHYSLWAAHSLWAGDVLNRDVFDPGSPLETLLSYLGQLATGHRPIGEALIAAAFRVTGVVFVYFIARGATGHRWIATWVTIVVAILLLPSGVYAMDRLVIYPGAVLLAWRYLANPRSASAVPMAILTAIAFLLRHDHGIYIGIPLLLTILSTRRSPLPFLATATVLVLPWALWVESTEGLATYFTTRVHFAQSLGLTAHRPGFGFTAGSLLTRENALRLLWQLAVITTGGALAFAVWLRDRRMAVLAVMAALAESGIMRELGRYPELVALWLPLGAWLASRSRHVAIVAVAAVMAVAITASAIAVTDAFKEAPQIAFGGGGLFNRLPEGFRLQSTYPPIDVYAPPGIGDDHLIVRYVHDCLNPDDRVWETSDWFSLPYQSERRLVEHPYWSLGFRRELDAEFAAALPARGMPPLIVVRDVTDPLQAFVHYPVTQALVAREYEPITSPRLEQFRRDVEDVQLLKFRGRTPSGRFEPLDLPCFRSN